MHLKCRHMNAISVTASAEDKREHRCGPADPDSVRSALHALLLAHRGQYLCPLLAHSNALVLRVERFVLGDFLLHQVPPLLNVRRMVGTCVGGAHLLENRLRGLLGTGITLGKKTLLGAN